MRETGPLAVHVDCVFLAKFLHLFSKWLVSERRLKRVRKELDEFGFLHVEVVAKGLPPWVNSLAEENRVELVQIQVGGTLVEDHEETRGVGLVRHLDLDSSGFGLVEVFFGALVVVAFQEAVDELLLVVLEEGVEAHLKKEPEFLLDSFLENLGEFLLYLLGLAQLKTHLTEVLLFGVEKITEVSESNFLTNLDALVGFLILVTPLN